MSRKLDRVDEFVILECLRVTSRTIGLRDAVEVANRLASIDGAIDAAKAKNCIQRKPVAEEMHSRLAAAAKVILQERRDEVLRLARRHFEDCTYRHLEQLLFDDIRSIDLIFRNWRNPPRTTSKVLETGIYQLFRRYKPTRDQASTNIVDTHYDWTQDENQVVICELLYLNFDSMECILITSELKVYFGTLYLNFEHQLYGLLQRLNARSNGVHQRFICSSMDIPELPLHSGICVKTGDTTRLPVAAEFLYLRVPNDHIDLYDGMGKLYEDFKNGPDKLVEAPLATDSIFAQYTTDIPPIAPYNSEDRRWDRVKFVRDFPALATRVRPDSDGIKLFREPIRAVAEAQLAKIARTNPTLETFVHQTQTDTARRDRHEAK